MTLPSKIQALRIPKWNERHENSETRKVKGSLNYIIVPTEIKLSLIELLGRREGLETFGAYIVVAEIGGRMPVRGLLANENGPLSIPQVCRLSGAPPKRLASSLDHLLNPPLRWLDWVDWPYVEPRAYGDAGGEPGSSWDSRPRTRPPAAAAAALNSSPSKDAAAAAAAPGLASIARRIGMGDLIPALNDRFPELDAAGLLAHWHQVQSQTRIDNKTGALRSRFTGDRHWPTPNLTPAALVAAAEHNPAVIVAVGLGGARFELAGREVGSNSHGFHVDKKLAIPSNRIAEIEIE